MKRAELTLFVVVIIGVGYLALTWLPRLSVRQSGEGFACGDYLIVATYGYSDDGDRLRFAILRTWPKNSTPEQRAADPRIGRDFLRWPLVRDESGRLVPVGTDGNIYFFEGDNLKTMRVSMNEHTDTGPLGRQRTLEEIWSYLQQFRID
jgi:hypothetical protein